MEKIRIPQTVNISVNELKTDSQNPNKLEKSQFQALKRNISEFGFIVPIVTNKDLIIADGEHRLNAARELGMLEVPVIRLDVDDVDRRILRQVMNKLRGQHDKEGDKLEFIKILEAERIERMTELLGYGKAETSRIMDMVREVNEVPTPEIPKKTDIKLGDIFTLGNHRLMCGDSTKEEDVDMLMGNESELEPKTKADMVFTSPPYNLGENSRLRGYNATGKDTAYIEKTDHKSQSEYIDFLKKSTKLMIGNAKYTLLNIQLLAGNKNIMSKYWNNFNDNFVDMIIWDKGHAQPARGERVLNSVFEIIFIFSEEKNPKRTINIGPGFKGTVDNIIRLKTSGTKEKIQKYHGAVFPIELPFYFVKTFTNENNIILDPFGGSGSTLMACEQLNRRCYMMEIDPYYCQVIIDRWEQYVGNKALKEEAKKEEKQSP